MIAQKRFTQSRKLRVWFAVCGVILLQAATASLASAQRPVSVALRAPKDVVSMSETQTRAATIGQEVAAESRGNRVGRHMLWGALIGGVGALVASYLVTHTDRVTDHSEDGLVYMVFVPVGVGIGAVAGALTGLTTSYQHK